MGSVEEERIARVETPEKIGRIVLQEKIETTERIVIQERTENN